MTRNRACLFVRVSTIVQCFERQLADLERYCKDRGLVVVCKISEKKSGGLRNEERPAIKELLQKAHTGAFDHVVVAELSRLGRNAFEVQKLIEELSGLGISITIQSLGIQTLDEAGKRSALSNLLLAILGQFAQMERAALIDRVQSGMAKAQARGVHCGRPRGSTIGREELLKKYSGVAADLRNGISLRKVAKIHGVCVNTVQGVKRAQAAVAH